MQETLFDELPAGVKILRNFISPEDQLKMVAKCRDIAKISPLVKPQTKLGFNFSLSVTSMGRWGWFSNPKEGYHYRRKHPTTGKNWEKMPRLFLRAAKAAALEVGCIYKPDTCLMNYYPSGTGRLGLHQDNTERDQSTAIVTISLGESCKFLIGGLQKTDKTTRVILHSGDICIMYREGRMLYHGVEALIPGSSDLLKDGGRISLTFRRHIPIGEEKHNEWFRTRGRRYQQQPQIQPAKAA